MRGESLFPISNGCKTFQVFSGLKPKLIAALADHVRGIRSHMANGSRASGLSAHGGLYCGVHTHFDGTRNARSISLTSSARLGNHGLAAIYEVTSRQFLRSIKETGMRYAVPKFLSTIQ